MNWIKGNFKKDMIKGEELQLANKYEYNCSKEEKQRKREQQEEKTIKKKCNGKKGIVKDSVI